MNSEELPAWKKILLIASRIGISIFVYLIFFISLLPLVSWWAGVIALVLYGIFYFIRYRFRNAGDETPRFLKRWMRWTFATIITGVVFYAGCSLDSNHLVHKLERDASSEKAKALK